MTIFTCPEDRWEYHPAEVVMCNGPDRVYDDSDNHDERVPVGFMSHVGTVDDDVRHTHNDWTPEPHPWCADCCCPPPECVHDPVQVPCTLPIPANVYDGMGCE
jgi:hypothetical protein